MRLIRTDISDGFILDEFDVEKAPPYAILSHRWGDNEVLLRDLTSDGPKDGARFDKIIGCCKQARKDGYSHVWIDTCCIDQRSSAELSESINSMFLWYTKAARCYVHLHDVSSKQDPAFKDSAFRASKWFTRGWTLQELIAPHDLVFFTQDWDAIGNKRELAGTIQEITKISYGLLCDCIDLAEISVAEKMSWASNRETTKVEDRAYSLLGIFKVNMTTIYGEGQKAFQRLQYEIISQSNDYSIFAWDVYPSDLDGSTYGLLAPSPDSFANSAGIIASPFLHFADQWCYQETVIDIQRTNTGIRLTVPIFEPLPPLADHTRRDACVIAIACKKREQTSSKLYYTIGVIVQLDSEGHYNRVANMDLHDADRLANSGAQWKIETLNMRSETERDPANNKSSRMLAYVPTTYEVVLKARMLNALRKSSSPMLFIIEDFNFFVSASSDEERSPLELHTWGWVEDSETKESDFVAKLQCGPGNLPAKHEYPDDHILSYAWKWGDMKLNLEIKMPDSDFVVCDAIALRDYGAFATGWIDTNSSAPKTNRYWNVNVPDRGTVGTLITLTDVTAEMVRYELDVTIHPSRPKTSSIAGLQRPAVTFLDAVDGPKQNSQESVQWVSEYLGGVPRGAFDSRGWGGWDRRIIVRARHEGIIKPGVLRDSHPWAYLFPSFDNKLQVLHRVCDYEVLVGTSDQIDWVLVEGPFTLEALRGAKPVIITGGDGDENTLYVAQGPTWDFGVVRVGSNPRLMDIGRANPTVNEYETGKYRVYVYKQ